MTPILYIVVGIAIGIVLTLITILLVDRFSTKPIVPQIDGILTTSLSKGTAPLQESFDAQIEFHVLAKTSEVAKIQVLNITVNKSNHATEETYANIKKIYDNTWVDINRLKFVVDLEANDRKETLDKIINS